MGVADGRCYPLGMSTLLLGLMLAALLAVLCVVFLLRSERDAVSALIGYSVVLFLIPAKYAVPGADPAGTPALLVGLLIAIWWLVSKLLSRPVIAYGPQPVRTVLLFYVGWILITYALAGRRDLSSIESSGSDKAVLVAIATFGVAMVAADGISNRRRLEKLLGWLVGLAAVVGLFALIQFFTPVDPVSYIRIPGLKIEGELAVESVRGDLNRPFSTTLHPIELGAVMAMLLPLALYRLSLPTASLGARFFRAGSAVLIGSTILISISRTALVAAFVALFYYALSLPARQRINLAFTGLVGLIAARMFVPGLIGTLTGLFLSSGEDTSVQARLSDVDSVIDLLSTYPILGWGPGTINPIEYLLLDNQYYLSALNTGIPGLILLFGIVAVGVRTGRQAVRHSDDPTRRLGYALVGGFLAGAVALATFDGLFFPMFTGLLFLMLGMIGALWRLELVGPLPNDREFHPGAETGPNAVPTPSRTDYVKNGDDP